MFFRSRFHPCLILLVLQTAAGFPAFSQDSGGSATGAISISGLVQPALTNVQQSVSALNIQRWKAPAEVRGAAQQNVGSILRDITGALPGLISAADSTSGSVPQAFAVYRNLDALYDVLLRVSETAGLAAPQAEAEALSSALQRLETARSQLGDSITLASQQREAQIVKLQLAAAHAAAAAPPTPAKTIVVDDGPPASTVRKRKKPAAKPAANTAAPAATPAPNQ